jgi:hypothetical protein
MPRDAYNETPQFGISSMSTRDILAANLAALMARHPLHNSGPALERATKALGQPVGKSTIDRATRSETPLNLDFLEVIAKCFGLDAWQLLVPNLNPAQPPVLRAVNPSEQQFYDRVRTVTAELTELIAREAPPKGTLR